MKSTHCLFILLSISASMASCNKKPQHGREIIELMKSKYNHKWYTHFTFSQHLNKYKNGELTESIIMHEAYSFPSKLILKFNDFESGEGILFINDNMLYMQDGKIASKSPRIHDVVVIGFDAYEQDIEIVLKKLKKQGYDLSKVHETTVEGKDAYCIGSLNEEEKVNRFYINKEHLYFLKNIRYNDGVRIETHFTNYKQIEGKWVATKILFYENNELVMDEEYFNIAFPEKLDQRIFDPENFKPAKW